MDEGARVTGVPFNPRTRAKYPTVTGYLKTIKYKGPEGEVEDQMILCGKSTVDIKNGTIKPAGRREKDTEL